MGSLPEWAEPAHILLCRKRGFGALRRSRGEGGRIEPVACRAEPRTGGKRTARAMMRIFFDPVPCVGFAFRTRNSSAISHHLRRSI